ncbi:MAG: polyprenyl synthetase family protein [Monoglobaceae bacterium]
MDFKDKYREYAEIIEKRLEQAFCVRDLPQRKVIEAMRYAVCGGGKRIRPVMTLAAAELCGGDMEDAAAVAAAVECVHNYSLIHDDLPCMDNDDFRRGRATCHKAYGENTAVLAGDGLLNFAFEILSDISAYRSLKAEQLTAIIRTLSTASGVMGMIGGQVVDLEYENKAGVSLEELLYLHAHKTGALIRAAVRCGCLCGSGDEEAKALDKYAESLGLAFQIKDDILDVTGNEGVLGKPVGSDAECGKTTFVTLLGMERASAYLLSETKKAKACLEPLGQRGEFFAELADFLLKREY